MGKVKGKRAARPRMNRLLGFSGTPTDAELDEVIDLVARLAMRFLTSEAFIEMMESGARFKQQVERIGRAFGDA